MEIGGLIRLWFPKHVFLYFFLVSPCPMTIKLDYLSFNAGLVEVMRQGHLDPSKRHGLQQTSGWCRF